MLSKLASMFRRKEAEGPQEKDAIAEVRNWYSDRYQSVLVQRNLLFLVTTLSLIGVLISVFTVERVISSKSIEPFVIEIESKTGITNVVDPATRSEMFADEALTKYFVVKYVNARETYDPLTYNFNYNTVTRLLSASKVYYQFRQFINSPDGPVQKYVESTRSEMKVRSVQIIKPGVAQVRFTLVLSGAKNGVFHYIAYLEYGFYTLEMTQDERFINPVGFQVNSYRKDEEVVSSTEQK